MATIKKRPLSGSTHGRPIKVVATGTPGTDIHTALATTTEGLGDEVWLYATNEDSVARDLTLEFGGVSNPDDRITITLQPKQGHVLVCAGLILRNALVVKAFASAANVVCIAGFVNRIE